MGIIDWLDAHNVSEAELAEALAGLSTSRGSFSFTPLQLATRTEARVGGFHYLTLAPETNPYVIYGVGGQSGNAADYGRYEIRTPDGDFDGGTVGLGNVNYYYDLWGAKPPLLIRPGESIRCVFNSAGAGATITMQILYREVI